MYVCMCSLNCYHVSSYRAIELSGSDESSQELLWQAKRERAIGLWSKERRAKKERAKRVHSKSEEGKSYLYRATERRGKELSGSCRFGRGNGTVGKPYGIVYYSIIV